MCRRLARGAIEDAAIVAKVLSRQTQSKPYGTRDIIQGLVRRRGSRKAPLLLCAFFCFSFKNDGQVELIDRIKPLPFHPPALLPHLSRADWLMALVGFVARDVADVTLQHAVHRLVCQRCHVYCTGNEPKIIFCTYPNILSGSLIFILKIYIFVAF